MMPAMPTAECSQYGSEWEIAVPAPDIAGATVALLICMLTALYGRHQIPVDPQSGALVCLLLREAAIFVKLLQYQCMSLLMC